MQQIRNEVSIMAEKKEKQYVSDNAQLMAEWDWEKNRVINLDPTNLASKSNKKAWWICKNGHEWKAAIADRTLGSGCPFCSKKIAIKGENDLQTLNPTLAKEWNFPKNNNLNPQDFLPNSNKKVWWKCKEGHEWQAKINSRNSGSGCPYCSGRYAVADQNDLLTVNPSLASEWNYSKNGELLPSHVMPKSHLTVWWKCHEGHEWQAKIDNRANGRGCPYCFGRKVLQEYNDLQTINPGLAKEWNCEKNGTLTPTAVSANSGKKVWWKCGSGHEWQALISNRSKGKGCPYCSGQKVLYGFNDFQTARPILAKEWNYGKNGELKPEAFTANSGKKVWWKCSKGHEWQATIYNRANGRGCPICNSERTTSFPEYALVYYLEKYGLEVIHSYRKLGYELDVYIPSLETAIEYDGGYWHHDSESKDIDKNRKCHNDGITLYRIREELQPLNDYSIDLCIAKKQVELQGAISTVLSQILGRDIDINLERDFIAIESLREYTEKEQSLLSKNAQLAAEWNYEKNYDLKPENVTPSSNKKVWWKCSNGHEWQATINSRNRGNGCPSCSGRLVIKGENDILTLNPVLAAEWNYSKNHSLLPEHCTPNSHEKVWWKCSKGHEWQAAIRDRNIGHNCPYCSGNKVLKGYNDLQTINPTVASEWNYEKNGDLIPENFTSSSSKKVWWKCINGHEWQATINNRSKGAGCPYCSGRYVIKGETDLQTVNPKLAEEWDYEMNIGLTPTDVSPNSNKKVWWKCLHKHHWMATIADRNNGRGCPYCSGRYAVIGKTDLQTVNPLLASEWDYSKNNGVTPAEVKPNSHRKVWWKCSQGHEWYAQIDNRNKGHGCPECAKQKRKKKDT